MRKILIIGLGKQGKKYIEYFTSKGGYTIDGVSRKKTNDQLKIDKHFIFDDILAHNSNISFNEYEYICVAVAPLSEQEKVMKLLLTYTIQSKIIIEKPIVSDRNLLSSLCYKKNIFFFIDEICLSQLLPENIGKIHIFAQTYDIFDHAIGFFLCRKDFGNIDIQISHTKKYGSDLNYKIYIDDQFSLNCAKGKIYVNNIEKGEVNFYKSIEYIIGISEKENQIIKDNFLLYLTNHF